MFASKFWNFLLAIIITVLAVIILLVPVSVNESHVQSTRSILLKDRTQLEAVLKMEARARIDSTIAFAVDPEVRKYLAMANRFKPTEKFTGEEQDALLASLRKVNENLGPMAADILFVVDKKGTVVAQIGENERSSGYSLRGFPLVDSAIRGYLRDDTWIRDGKPYRMAARPVIHQGTYEGAVIHGMRMDRKLAEVLSAATHAQAALFVDGLVTDSVAPKPQAGDEEKEAQGVTFPGDNAINRCLGESVFTDENYTKKGRSNLVLCEMEPESGKGEMVRFFVTALKFVGEARNKDAGVAIIRTVPQGITVEQFIRAPERRAELASRKGMLGVIGAVAFFLILVGLLVVYLEGDRPKSRFLAEVEGMAAREGERLNIYRFRGKYRKIADAVNRAIDNAVKVLVSKATSDAPTVDKILGPKGTVERLSQPQFQIPEKISLDDIAPPPDLSSPPKPEAPRPPAPRPEPPVTAETQKDMPHAAGPKPPLPAPRPPAAKPMPPSKKEQDPETRYARIYKEFFDTKTTCGESTEGLTYERFRATLKKQEEAIFERTKCSSVDFRVYVKEGKAALKATPVK